MMNWIHDGLVLTFALAGGILWTILSRIRNNPRTDYRTLHAGFASSSALPAACV
jgi:hypothetical protein